MPKVLGSFLTVISIVAQISYFLAYFIYFFPIIFVIQYFSGSQVKSILASGDIRIIPGHIAISHTALNSFPGIFYTIAMVVGTVLLGIGIIKFLGAIIDMISALDKKEYFTNENVLTFKKMFLSQWYLLGSTPFLAFGNQLLISYFGRQNYGLIANSWSDIFGNLATLSFFWVLYILFSRAIELKHENDLTV